MKIWLLFLFSQSDRRGLNLISTEAIDKVKYNKDELTAKVLNVNKNPIKTAQNMLNFGRNIKVYLFDSDYKFISQDCQ
ncbi:hypothetical protein, partial [Nostoc sp.]|uniref:hypothetical protein n=1 Tax=Nostoc sp. TaxID=1180 RepID=UPI002FF87EFB